jgi:hypothetical protein
MQEYDNTANANERACYPMYCRPHLVAFKTACIVHCTNLVRCCCLRSMPRTFHAEHNTL